MSRNTSGMSDQHVHTTHPDIAKRLKRAEGQLRSIVEMIETGRPLPRFSCHAQNPIMNGVKVKIMKGLKAWNQVTRALLAVQHRVRAALRRCRTRAHIIGYVPKASEICGSFHFGPKWLSSARKSIRALSCFLVGHFTFPDQLFEPFPFVRAQFDTIKLLAHLLLRR